MRLLYSLLLYLSVPLVLAKLALRGRKAPGYWQRWGERFGFYDKPLPGRRLWLHAVSVGETQAALPLIRALMAHYPKHRLVITSTTVTGSARVKAAFGDSVDHVYLPYDLPDAVARFLGCFRPELGIIMETELWPNLVHGCTRRGIPTLLANGRLSDRSCRGYAKLRWLIAPLLENIDRICARDEQDAARFQSLGAPTDTVRVCGNLKYDLQISALLQEQAQAFAGELGRNRLIWVAASTHEGEDAIVLEAHQQVLSAHPDALLILVPRHPERFSQVGKLCKETGFNTAKRSSGQAIGAEHQVLLGDTMGEMMLFYAIADLAFVGGSLVDNGGHNPLEPAALGLAILQGPHTHNFVEVNDTLGKAGALIGINDADTLAVQVTRLLAEPELRTAHGEAGRRVMQENGGALQRILDEAAKLLGD